jgi:HEAT repeat protein
VPVAPSPAVIRAGRDLAGADAAVASAAAAELGRDRSAPGLEVLLDALALGLHPQVAAAAIDATAQRKSPAALDVLTHYARHRTARVRARAVRALGAIYDRRAEQPIFAALVDGEAAVRSIAADAVVARKLTGAVPTLKKLMARGEEPAALALAALATPELAKDVAETIGTAPDALVARCLGAILARRDFKPEAARVEVVRALGRVPGPEALEELTKYVGEIPAKPPRKSRAEAEALIEARQGGGA